MSAEVTNSSVVDQYLKRLSHALRRARSGDREDYLDQISEHLNETRVPGDSLDDLIRRVGSPEALAEEFYATERAKLSKPSRLWLWLRHWWVVVIGLAALIAFAVIYTWAGQYQPLSLYMNGGYRDKIVSFNGAPAKKLVGGFSAPVTWELTHGHYRISILFDASNMNSLSVNISPPEIVNGFPNPGTWHLENSQTGSLTPFVSAQVGGGQYQEVVYSTTYVCTPWPKNSSNVHATSSSLITTLPIVESFFGFQHTVALAVQPFYLEFAGNCFGVNS
jgi:hypothetical protein